MKRLLLFVVEILEDFCNIQCHHIRVPFRVVVWHLFGRAIGRRTARFETPGHVFPNAKTPFEHMQAVCLHLGVSPNHGHIHIYTRIEFRDTLGKL